MDPRASEILRFWFSDALNSDAAAKARYKVWFRHDPQFDAEIQRRFADLPDQAAAGALDTWMLDAHAALAHVLVLDQFPRNLFRNDARAFAYDAVARLASLDAIGHGFDDAVHPLQAVFFYLPFEHAEAPELQEQSVALFAALRERAPHGCEAQFDGFVDYARRHRDVIARFGRFPHRNGVLARISTADEIRYLDSGGERFGAQAR
jgi:uncharacterized protein (DUF924 family)